MNVYTSVFFWIFIVVIEIIRGYIGCDVIFMLDSSGSVLDPDGNNEYINWQSEIDFAKNIVNQSLNRNNTRVGTINFSGCSSRYSFEECRDDWNRLKKMWGLNDYGNPYNNLSLVYNRFNSMGANDFNGGLTWTNDALKIALREFKINSSDDRLKTIVLLTDGEPTKGHEACNSTGYKSDILYNLEALGVTIIAVGIDISQLAIEEFFSCVTRNFSEYFYYANDFNSLYYLWDSIAPLICKEIKDLNLTLIPTTEPTFQPTLEPTLQPTSQPTFEPTFEPTSEPTIPTKRPTFQPTMLPTVYPSNSPIEAMITTLTSTESTETEFEFSTTEFEGPVDGVTMSSWIVAVLCSIIIIFLK